ncbi:MAG: type II toxin-antitoxin system PemK/MazF family toxin [Alphaproteobacteria bacterium]|nr:type II toxin-antitoxin system PemK/MazF family toxin [Alphaproteobacteria bacterium]
MTFSRWDVVAVNYFFMEGDTAKHRPGVIVSTDRLHKAHDLCVVAMVTTARAGIRPDDIAVSDLARAGLPVPCVIRSARLVTMNAAMVARRSGTLAMKDRNAVAAMLKAFLL